MANITEQEFLSEVTNHRMTLIRDDGIDRHIRFREPGSICYSFDLITWPGHLCFTGDCGTFVFRRLQDMFEFFRSRNNHDQEGLLKINPGYWAEKLEAVDRQCGYSEFDAEAFRKQIHKEVNEWEFEDKEQKAEVWADIRANIFSPAEDYSHSDTAETLAMTAAIEYRSEYGHEFSDFWEYQFKRPTHRYLWCLYAIVWGIDKYDQSKLAVAA